MARGHSNKDAFGRWWLWSGAAAGLYGIAWLAARHWARRAEREFPPGGELLTVEGVPLHYVRRGDGRPLVLLHGSDGFLQDYTLTVMERLAEQYDTVALDRPGHGYSGLPPGERATAPVQARLIHNSLQQLGVHRPVLVGHSWSALLLLYYAWRYPDDCAGLVLLAPWVYPGRSGEPLLRIISRPWISRILYPLFAPVKRLTIRWFLDAAFGAHPVPDDYRRQAEALWLRSPRQLEATARENSGVRKALCGFSPGRVPPHIPVAVVAGDRDRVTPLEWQAQRLKAEMPQAQVMVIPNAGHELMHTEPDAVVRAVDEICEQARAEHGVAGRTTPQGKRLTGRERARALVMRFGWNAAAYQILNPDIEHWFSAAGEACVGYVTWGGVRVVAGAPVCAEERIAEVCEEFECEARQADESVCYFGAAERLRSHLNALPSHSTVPVGAQPVWQPGRWADILNQTRSLRAQLNRARNKGVRIEEWERARAAADPGLQRCLDEWLDTHGGFDLHFLTEPVALDGLDDRRIFTALQADQPVGFLVATPVPERRGWLVEQVVRGKAAPNGTAELLIDGLMRSLAEEKYDYVTLGLSPLSRRGGAPLAPRLWIRLLLAWVRAHGARFYNFEGLDAFKGKFQPDYWEPIFAISNETRFSLRTLYGVAAAFTNGAPVIAIGRAVLSAVQQEWRWLRKSAPRNPADAQTVR